MVKFFALITLALLGGCTGARYLIPNTVTPEFEHMSHLTQHEPFTNQPTRYGSDLANLVLHWDVTHHVKFELAEGISLDRHWIDRYECGDGEQLGPREQFSMRVGYSFTVRQ